MVISTQTPPSDFTSRCITMLEKLGDDASNTEDHEKTLRAYSTALLLTPPSPSSLLVKWANIMLLHGSPDALLGAAAKVCTMRTAVYG